MIKRIEVDADESEDAVSQLFFGPKQGCYKHRNLQDAIHDLLDISEPGAEQTQRNGDPAGIGDE